MFWGERGGAAALASPPNEEDSHGKSPIYITYTKPANRRDMQGMRFFCKNKPTTYTYQLSCILKRRHRGTATS